MNNLYRAGIIVRWWSRNDQVRFEAETFELPNSSRFDPRTVNDIIYKQRTRRK